MKYPVIGILWFLAYSAIGQAIGVIALSCEYKTNPLGIDAAQPRLSWKLKAQERDVMQTAYAIQVATSPDFTSKTMVWETGKVPSGESVLQEYKGPALNSGNRYFWQVQVWDNQGRQSAWSETAWWETGLLKKSDWKATWIEADTAAKRYAPAPMLRREFKLKKNIAEARVYVTSHGYYELHLNGQKVGDQELTPGWTSYNKRLQYQVYDVTSMLHPGANAIGAFLGDGWYRGTLGWVFQWAIYGPRLGLLCQLHIRYSDGSEEWINTDKNWKAWLNGPIRMGDIYNGETYDAQLEIPGWDMPGFNDTRWPSAFVANYPFDNLLASDGAPVRRIQEIPAQKIFRTPKGELVVDLGQNMVGWVRLKVQGPAGSHITLQHAEVLDKEGNFYTENLRDAKCALEYTLKGGGTEVYEPRFTFMGFRYVKIEGWPGDLKPGDITGVVVHSDMPNTGTFECSDAMLNQLQHNIQWGQKGNFVDVPTDCPQRDERLGWTGDAQAFCRTAAFNTGVGPFYTKWAADIAADQGPDGAVPFVIPDVLNKPDSKDVGVSAGWSDVATILPWTMYQVYGDKRLLETQYPSMKAWVEYQRTHSGDSCVWKGGSIFGDWLFYRPGPWDASTPDGHTDRDMIATMFYAHSTDLLQQAAAVLGKTEDARYYAELFAKIKAAFLREYVTSTGRLVSHSQTAYVLALEFDLMPEELRQAAVNYLVEDIHSRNNHLATGFLGTPYLCHVLSDNEQTELAYTLLFQQDYPSWLYPVKMGATTIWERWDGIKTDSTFQDAGMNSFNHYAYGAIGDWMYRVVAGIELGAPGYKQIRIQPHPTPNLEYAKATYESMYGTISSGWRRSGDYIYVSVTVPPNTTAQVFLPGAYLYEVTQDGAQLELRGKAYQDKEIVVVEVGSGVYEFRYKVDR